MKVLESTAAELIVVCHHCWHSRGAEWVCCQCPARSRTVAIESRESPLMFPSPLDPANRRAHAPAE